MLHPNDTPIIVENSTGRVPVKKVLIIGLVMSIFNPPFIGLTYALLLAFNSDTRRTALYVALWAILWAFIYAGIFKIMLMNGYVPAYLKP